jgi:hypothetical protein
MIEKEVTMRRMEAQIRKLKRGMDESFRITRPDGSTYVNYTCSQGKMVTVDYFALQDLIEFYEGDEGRSQPGHRCSGGTEAHVLGERPALERTLRTRSRRWT